MYELAKDLTVLDRNIPKGTKLSDVYTTDGGLFTAFAHLDGERIKITLMASEFTHRKLEK